LAILEKHEELPNLYLTIYSRMTHYVYISYPLPYRQKLRDSYIFSIPLKVARHFSTFVGFRKNPPHFETGTRKWQQLEFGP